jgi:hypothetical protein
VFDASFADPSCCDPLVNTIALRANGDVLIGVIFPKPAADDRFYFVRFSSSGVFDPSFPAAAIEPQPGALMVAPDGSIYLSNNGTGVLARCGGTPDGSFGSVVTDGEIYSFALQPGGEILIAGTFANVGGAPPRARTAQRRWLARLIVCGRASLFRCDQPERIRLWRRGTSRRQAVVIGNFTFVESAPRRCWRASRPATTRQVRSSCSRTAPVSTSPGIASATDPARRRTDADAFDRWRELQRGWPDDVANGWHASAPFDVRGAPIGGRNDGRRRAGCVARTGHERHLLERYDFRRRLR